MASLERYAPDSNLVVSNIRKALFADNASEICDVIIRSGDHQLLPACRTLLAIRSPYFRNLFFSDFAERNAAQVDIGLPARMLHAVLEFAYTGDCALVMDILVVTRSCHLSKQVTPQQCRQHIVDLVDLGMAADYCHLDELNRWCKETLRNLIRAIPKAACLLFDKIETQNATSEMVNRERLIKSIASKPVECFAIQDVCGPQDPFSSRSIRLEDLDSSQDNVTCEFGVLTLSAPAMLNLIPELVKMMPERGCSKLTHEYLFQVIQYWTNNIPEFEGDENKTAQETKRWEQGKKLVAQICLRSMNPMFVKDYVDNSDLADREVLLDAYRHHATRQFHTHLSSSVIQIDDYGMDAVMPKMSKFGKRQRRRNENGPRGSSHSHGRHGRRRLDRFSVSPDPFCLSDRELLPLQELTD